MKKVSILILITLPYIFFSCSKDEDVTDYGKEIIGKWRFEKSVATEVKTNNKNAKDAIIEDIEEGNDLFYYTFSSNNIVKVEMEGEPDIMGTYSLNGDKLTIIYEDDTLTPTISISGNQLVLSWDDTKYYQDEIKYLIDDISNVSISKVVSKQYFTLLNK